MSKVGWWERKFSPSSILHKIGLLYPWKKKGKLRFIQWSERTLLLSPLRNFTGKEQWISSLWKMKWLDSILLLLSIIRSLLTFFARNLRESQLSDVGTPTHTSSNSFCTVPILPPPETCLIQIRKPITLLSKWIMAKSSHHHLINVARQHFIAF